MKNRKTGRGARAMKEVVRLGVENVREGGPNWYAKYSVGGEGSRAGGTGQPTNLRVTENDGGHRKKKNNKGY